MNKKDEIVFIGDDRKVYSSDGEHIHTLTEPPMKTWWMSFVDPDKPAGKRFLGVAIVEGRSFKEAHWMSSHVWHCNPGGEIEATDVSEIAYKIPLEKRNRLLSKKELDAWHPEH